MHTLHPEYRPLLKPTLEELRSIEEHLVQVDQQMADLLAEYHQAVQRLAEVPGSGSIAHSRSSPKSAPPRPSMTARAAKLDARTGYRRVVGESPAWRQVLTHAMRVAGTPEHLPSCLDLPPVVGLVVRTSVPVSVQAFPTTTGWIPPREARSTGSSRRRI